MRRFFMIASMAFLVLGAHASGTRKFHRYNCMVNHDPSRSVTRSVSEPIRTWDPEKIYHVPVVLMSFVDCDFSKEDPRTYYDRLFNETGYNEGHGLGCVADYFLDQSGGQCHFQFDVVGPFKVEYNQKSKSNNNYGDLPCKEAIQQSAEELDYALYDWNQDGVVEGVVVIYAGYGGNESVSKVKGCIWPNTGYVYFSVGDLRIDLVSASAELWSNDAGCGIGTICHEFSHVLGLPDLYPTSSSEFSVLDEWDLMDGGNYTDNGWCPPNYSIMERQYMGWQHPEDLTSSVLISDMRSLGSGGTTYRIVNDAYENEYYLLENRQQEGWDTMIPGHGLLITHIDFDDNAWRGNYVNTDPQHHRMEYFHSDGLDFNYYWELYEEENRLDEFGRSLRLKDTAYPYTDSDGVLHDALTDTTYPCDTVFNARANGSTLMGQWITDIRENEGKISFSFSDTSVGVREVTGRITQEAFFDLQGRKLPASALRPGTIYVIRYSDGTTKKLLR